MTDSDKLIKILTDFDNDISSIQEDMEGGAAAASAAASVPQTSPAMETLSQLVQTSITNIQKVTGFLATTAFDATSKVVEQIAPGSTASVGSGTSEVFNNLKDSAMLYKDAISTTLNDPTLNTNLENAIQQYSDVLDSLIAASTPTINSTVDKMLPMIASIFEKMTGIAGQLSDKANQMMAPPKPKSRYQRMKDRANKMYKKGIKTVKKSTLYRTANGAYHGAQIAYDPQAYAERQAAKYRKRATKTFQGFMQGGRKITRRVQKSIDAFDKTNSV
jgi:uncharacterized protein YukE